MIITTSYTTTTALKPGARNYSLTDEENGTYTVRVLQPMDFSQLVKLFLAYKPHTYIA